MKIKSEYVTQKIIFKRSLNICKTMKNLPETKCIIQSLHKEKVGKNI